MEEMLKLHKRLAAAADLPLADLKKLWRAVYGIVDAH